MPVATAREYQEGMLRRLRVLIVGGGATGQVFGYYLSQAGVEVSYYLKPRYAAEAEDGFSLHPFGIVGKRAARHFEGFEVFTRPDEIRHITFDQIWLCVSSPAIHSGIVERLDAVCPNSLWVSLQPGIGDREYLMETIPADRLISGMIGFVAYQAPLPGEDIWPEGVAYFLPPLSPTLFQGPEPYVSAVANLLQSGGMKAGVRPDVSTIAKYGSAVLIPFVVAAETRRWSLTALRKDSDMVGLLCAAIEEVFDAVKAETGTPPGSASAFTRSWALKAGLFAAPILAPFPLEPYLEFHFTKVRDQSDQMMDSFIRLCGKHVSEADAVTTLRDVWLAQRPEIEDHERDLEPTGRVPLAKRPEEPTVPPASMAREASDPSAEQPTQHETERELEPTAMVPLARRPGAQSEGADDGDVPVVAFGAQSDSHVDDRDLEPTGLVPLAKRPIGDDAPVPIELGEKLEVGPATAEDEDLFETIKPEDVPDALRQAAAAVVSSSDTAEEARPGQPPASYADEETVAEVDEPEEITELAVELEPDDSSAAETDEGSPSDEAPIQFNQELPEEERDQLGRQDFIQTELAAGSTMPDGGKLGSAMQTLGKPTRPKGTTRSGDDTRPTRKKTSPEGDDTRPTPVKDAPSDETDASPKTSPATDKKLSLKERLARLREKHGDGSG